ncbi:MAG: hypothetical protein IKO49_04920 [Bacilli bacterium]|nr:hypothetical protein [Bacilli bacterium]
MSKFNADYRTMSFGPVDNDIKNQQIDYSKHLRDLSKDSNTIILNSAVPNNGGEVETIHIGTSSTVDTSSLSDPSVKEKIVSEYGEDFYEKIQYQKELYNKMSITAGNLYLDETVIAELMDFKKKPLDLGESDTEDKDTSSSMKQLYGPIDPNKYSKGSLIAENHLKEFKEKPLGINSTENDKIHELTMPKCDFGSDEYYEYIDAKYKELEDQQEILETMLQVYIDLVQSTGCYNVDDYGSVSAVLMDMNKKYSDDGMWLSGHAEVNISRFIQCLMDNNIDPTEFFGLSKTEIISMEQGKLWKYMNQGLQKYARDIQNIESAISSTKQVRDELWWRALTECEDFKNFKAGVFPEEVDFDDRYNPDNIPILLDCLKHYTLTRSQIDEFYGGHSNVPPAFAEWTSGLDDDIEMAKKMTNDPDCPEEWKNLDKITMFLRYKLWEDEEQYNSLFDDCEYISVSNPAAEVGKFMDKYITQYEGYNEFKDFFFMLDKQKFSETEISSFQTDLLDYKNSHGGVFTYREVGEVLKNNGSNSEQVENFMRMIEQNTSLDNAATYDEVVEALKAYEWIDSSDIDNYVYTSIEGGSDGVKGYLQSIFGWIDNNEYSAQDYKNMYIAEALANYSGLNWTYNISSSIGNMAPSILLSIVNPALGKFSFFTSSGGASYRDAKLNYGANNTQGFLYAMISGLSEVTLESFLGGIPGLSDVNVTDLKSFVGAMLKEGNEELIQNFVGRTASRMLGIDKNADIVGAEYLREDLETFAAGAITGGIFNIPSLAIAAHNSFNNTGNATKVDINSVSPALDMNIEPIFKSVEKNDTTTTNPSIDTNIKTEEKVDFNNNAAVEESSNTQKSTPKIQPATEFEVGDNTARDYSETAYQGRTPREMDLAAKEMFADLKITEITFDNKPTEINSLDDIKTLWGNISTRALEFPSIEVFDTKLDTAIKLWPQLSKDGNVNYLFGKGIGAELALQGNVKNRVKNIDNVTFRTHSDMEIYDAKSGNPLENIGGEAFYYTFGSEETRGKTDTKFLHNIPEGLMDSTYDTVEYKGNTYLVPELELLFLDKFFSDKTTKRGITDHELLMQAYHLDIDKINNYFEKFYKEPRMDSFNEKIKNLSIEEQEQARLTEQKKYDNILQKINDLYNKYYPSNLNNQSSIKPVEFNGKVMPIENIEMADFKEIFNEAYRKASSDEGIGVGIGAAGIITNDQMVIEFTESGIDPTTGETVKGLGGHFDAQEKMISEIYDIKQKSMFGVIGKNSNDIRNDIDNQIMKIRIVNDSGGNQIIIELPHGEHKISSSQLSAVKYLGDTIKSLNSDLSQEVTFGVFGIGVDESVTEVGSVDEKIIPFLQQYVDDSITPIKDKNILSKSFDNVPNPENVVVDFTNEDITSLIGKADLKDYTMAFNSSDLSSVLHNSLDPIVGSQNVNLLINSMNIIPANQWNSLLRERGLSENIVGFVDKNSHLYIPDNANLHTVVHENLHRFSELSKQRVSFGDNTYKVTGIREFYQDGRNTGFANEVLTEYLASKISDGKLYQSMYGVFGVEVWERIDQLLNAVYGENNYLLTSYITNNVNFIRSFIDNYSGTGTYDSIVLGLDATESNKIKITNILDTVTNNVFRNLPNLKFIDKIKLKFGINIDIDKYTPINFSKIQSDTTTYNPNINQFTYNDITALGYNSSLYIENEYRNNVHTAFAGIYNDADIDMVLNQVRILSDAEWNEQIRQNGFPSNIFKFADRYGNYYFKNDSNINSIYSVIIRKLSTVGSNNTNMEGITQYYQDGSSSANASKSLADYLASKIFGWDYYDSVENNTSNKYYYNELWSRLDTQLENIYPNQHILLTAFLYHDVNFLRSFVDTYSYQGAYDSLVLSMQDTQANQVLFDDVMARVEKNVSKYLNPDANVGVFGKIKSIFSNKKEIRTNKFRNTDELLSKFTDPLNDYQKLENLHTKLFEAKRTEMETGTSISVYSIITRLGNNIMKKLPSFATCSNYFSQICNPNNTVILQKNGGIDIYNSNDLLYEQSNAFLHVRSKTFDVNDVGHRLYANVDLDTLYKILPDFINECEKQGLDYYFKTACYNGTVYNDFQFTRDESIVIYSNKENLYKYYEIFSSCLSKVKNIEYGSLPQLSATIDGVIGYGAEPRASGRESFNSLRAKAIDWAFNLLNDWEQKNWSPNYTTEQRLNNFYYFLKESANMFGINPDNFAMNKE